MQTAKAVVQDPAQNQSVETRALFDSGSQRSYITENLAKLLELTPIEEETLTLCTFGSKDIKKIPSNVVDLDVRTIDNKSIRMRVNTTPCITRDFTKSCLAPSVDRSRFESLQFADDYFSEEPNSSIQLLIGNDYYFKFILQDRRVVRDGLYLIVKCRVVYLLSRCVWESTGCVLCVSICLWSALWLSLLTNCVAARG